MPDTPTTHYGWVRPLENADGNTWGDILNDTLEDIDGEMKAVSDVADAALPRAGGTMTGRLEFLAGSAASPGLTPAGDTNSGLYSLADDQLGVACNGAAVGSFRSSGWNGAVVGDVTGDLTGAVDGSTGAFSGLLELNGGGLNTPRSSPTAADVGFLGSPKNDQSGGPYTLSLSDVGKTVIAWNQISIPQNAAVPFPVGSVVHIVAAGSPNTTILASLSATLKWGAATGTRDLAPGRMARLWKADTDTWYIDGPGLS